MTYLEDPAVGTVRAGLGTSVLPGMSPPTVLATPPSLRRGPHMRSACTGIRAASGKTTLGRADA
ncbi:hypothetical protein OHB26_28325 [Nocardia sp. NBC_01503]|uniref:hypothetical protein n=1 Tax=Nocardia sp. NBC_01503 TaxID=2975997 RepID=UPI002E7B4A02|nr:hypothetical protein [Nocardia sp. NBC_01503]WTL30814.1 hypothetical protein OHB26_28325 [Nocardia sp. NBC_01503]